MGLSGPVAEWNRLNGSAHTLKHLRPSQCKHGGYKGLRFFCSRKKNWGVNIKKASHASAISSSAVTDKMSNTFVSVYTSWQKVLPTGRTGVEAVGSCSMSHRSRDRNATDRYCCSERIYHRRPPYCLEGNLL